MEPLNVAIVAQRFPCASQTFVLDHATGLLDRGHRVSLFAASRDVAPAQHADHAHYDLDRLARYWPSLPNELPGRALAFLRSMAALPAVQLAGLLRQVPRAPNFGPEFWSLLRRALVIGRHDPAPDLVHVHFGGEGERIARLKASGALRGPLIVSMHGYDVNQPLAQGGSPYPMLFRQADRIVATTRFMAGQVLALGCPAEKLVQNPVGIRTSQFPFAPRQWNVSEPLRVLTVARLVAFKGVDLALRAVARASGAGVRIHYTVVGDGPSRHSLERLAGELGIRSNVDFLGTLGREAVVRQLESSHLFVLASRTGSDGAAEGQGIVIQEAQACGVPVLATRHGGIPEGCEDGVTALLVPENDVDALASGLRQLVERRALWGEMGAAGRRLVEQRFDLDAHLDRTERMYRDLGFA